MQKICMRYIAQHICLHKLACTQKEILVNTEIHKKGTVQLIIALYSIVEKTRSGRHPRSSEEKSFSTSTDGFRRHGASREAALDSKMLLKAVLIVCVVRKERKSKRLAVRARLLFPSLRRGDAQTAASTKTGRREPRALASLGGMAKGERVQRLTFDTSLRRDDFLARAHMTHLAKSEATCTGPLNAFC